MPIAPFTGTADAETKINVAFTSGHVDLSNIDFHSYLMKIDHVLQAEGKGLMKYAKYMPVKGTFKWCHLVEKRDPFKRTKEAPEINSRSTTFKTFGMVLQGYDDDALIPEYTERNGIISVSSATFQAMKKGFMRLLDKLILTGCIQPRISRDTSTSSVWKEGTHERVETAFPDSRVFGNVSTNTAGVASLLDPGFATIQRIKRFLFESKFPRDMPIYSILNPRMENVIENYVQYQNKDHIFAQTRQALHDKAMVVPFYGINFVRVDNDIIPQAFYNSKKFAKGANNTSNTLQPISSSSVASGDVDLGDGTSNSQRYTVIPFWSPAHLCWGSDPVLSKAKMFRVPYYKQTPLVTMTEYIGATRSQDEAFAILIIPRDASER